MTFEIGDDINSIGRLGAEGWRNLKIYVYGRGVITLGEFLPNYRYWKDWHKIATFFSDTDLDGVRLALNKEREIVILDKLGQVLVIVGLFCDKL